MLTFLAPTALIGLSLLAIPIIVHLLKPRKVRRTPFSSLRWLHLTQQRLARRIRWHQVLLFLLRASFITLLVLAIAKPIFNRGESTGPTERFVVLDVSRSMGYKAGERPTPLETGKQLAASLLAGEQAGDRTALLATGSTTQVLGPLVQGGEKHATALTALQPLPTDTDLGSALEVIRPILLKRRPEATAELYFITDNCQGAWRQNAVESLLNDLPEKSRVTVFDVSDPSPQNGWIADCRLTEGASPGSQAIGVQLRCVGNAQERSIRLVGLPGIGERTRSVALESGRPTQLSFELPPDYETRGKSAEVVLEPADALPGDDRWFLSLDGDSTLRVLLVEGSPQAGDAAPPGFALATAIESLSSPAQSIELTTKKYNEVEPADFRNLDAVLLADVPELSDSARSALDEAVRGGLGLAIFLGPGVMPEFYNNQLVDPLVQGGGLMPVRIDRVEEVPQSKGGLAPLVGLAWNHPLLTGLFDPTLGDLVGVQARAWYRFSTSLPPADATLATVAGVPAIVEHTAGSGKVLLFNTTANDAWSDLARRKSFVPLVDRLLNYLSGGAARRTFLAGDTMTLATAPPREGETLSVVAPDGATLTPSVSMSGKRAIVRLASVSAPGLYQVKAAGASEPQGSFVVQVGRGDSLLAPTDGDLLRSWWRGTPLEIVRAEAATERLAAAGTRIPLTVWLAALAAALLAAEMFFVHWLCPRMNPALTDSMHAVRRPLVSASTSEVR